MGRGLRNAVVALLGLVAPLAAACALLTPRVHPRAGPVASPNPQRAPSQLLSPVEVLVACDPYYAGIIGPWMLLWCIVGVTLVVAAATILPRIASRWLGNAWSLFLAALLMGTIAAAPWWHCVMFHGP